MFVIFLNNSKGWLRIQDAYDCVRTSLDDAAKFDSIIE
jgi:hypothetical protein